MSRSDLELHLAGASRFVADLPVPAGTVELAILGSHVAHGIVRGIDLESARHTPGFVALLTAADIPGRNQIGGIVEDEHLLATEHVHYVGDPIAIVAADTIDHARAARARIVVTVEELEPILDPRVALSRGELLVPSRTFECGDVDAAFARSRHVVTGRVDIGAQEHVYLETQAALALPTEQGGIRVFSATQSPTAVQRVVANVLGIEMHLVEVEVPRLGGGFGGKEDQATAWAALAALAATKLGRPARLVLRRDDDLRMTGKRHPYSADYRLGLDADGNVLAYEVDFVQDGGAAADLSPAILERSLFHATGAYRVPNARIHAQSCRTNTPPNTAFRGFGAPQAFFVIEAAMRKAAAACGIPVVELQRKNLLRERDTFPYGMRAERCLAERTFDALDTRFDLAATRARIDAYNADHRLTKKGLAVVPVCFGISFTTTFLNQASALVHVHQDGSVSISTAAVEMGQGVNEKMRLIAARTLTVPVEHIHVASTDTERIANTAPTAASTGADLNGHAVRLACEALHARMITFVAETFSVPLASVVAQDGRFQVEGRTEALAFADVAGRMFRARRNLSAHAHYATPGIGFERNVEKGRPFQYHVYGTGLVEATLDVLRGTYVFEALRVVHDAGATLAPAIDRGQIEGAALQGLGLVTCEEILRDSEGRLLSDSLATYKVPDFRMAPAEVEVEFLGEPFPDGVYGSKAVGEPPLIYGLAAYFAIADAIRAARPDAGLEDRAPLTPERVLMSLT